LMTPPRRLTIFASCHTPSSASWSEMATASAGTSTGFPSTSRNSSTPCGRAGCRTPSGWPGCGGAASPEVLFATWAAEPAPNGEIYEQFEYSWAYGDQKFRFDALNFEA